MRLDHLLSRERTEAGRRSFKPRSIGRKDQGAGRRDGRQERRRSGEKEKKKRNPERKSEKPLIPYRFQDSARKPEGSESTQAHLDNCTRKERESKDQSKGDKITEQTLVSGKIKRRRAQGGCQGTNRRRRTRPAAKSCGESQADIDPQISEWGNPAERSSAAVC